MNINKEINKIELIDNESNNEISNINNEINNISY